MNRFRTTPTEPRPPIGSLIAFFFVTAACTPGLDLPALAAHIECTGPVTEVLLRAGGRGNSHANADSPSFPEAEGWGTQPSDNDPPSDSTTVSPAETRLDRSSPRATMETFLIAIAEAEGGKVERYADAIACLDLSGLAELPADARRAQARKYASKLNAYLDKHGIDRELIPDDAGGEPYAYRDTPIRIRRSGDGVWRFTPESLAYVAELSAETPATAAAPPAKQDKPAEPVAGDTAGLQTNTVVPPEFRSPRATMRTFQAAMRAGKIDQAAACLDLSEFPRVVLAEKGAELAGLLHEVISRTQRVVLQSIPDRTDGPPFVFKDYQPGVVAIARLSAPEEYQGRWLFTKETLAGLESIYDRLLASGETAKGPPTTAAAPFSPALWLRTHIPDSLKDSWFLLKHWQWIGLAVVLLVGWFAHRLTTFVLRVATAAWLRRRRARVAEAVQVNLARPVGILAGAAVWWIGLTWLALRADVLAVLLTAVKFIACWATVWAVYRAVDLLCDYFAYLAAKTENKMDDLLVPFVRKTAKALITIFGVVFIVQQFTENRIPELLAGLGLGGLAVALAAQDSLKNLFGSFTLIVDRPFKVGDWVVVGDVEGTVESLGFRSTRIRTFYNSQMTVPNATLMSATVDNYGARRFRRARVMLSLTYSTPPEKIDAFCEGVRELIRLHPYTRKDYYHVYFNQFAASSLDILLYVFFEVPDWGTELRERHRLFVDIIRLANRLGVEFAFPTQTIWMERTHRDAATRHEESLPDDPVRVGIDHAATLFEQAYGTVHYRPGPVVIESTPRCRRDNPNSHDHPTEAPT